MSKGIRISPKHGLNPTIPVCFWCGKEKNEIALMGVVRSGNDEDFKMPMYAVVDYEPCEECARNMELGFTVIEATRGPNAVTNMEIQKGIYPTGRFVVISQGAAELLFREMDRLNKCFVDVEAFEKILWMYGCENKN